MIDNIQYRTIIGCFHPPGMKSNSNCSDRKVYTMKRTKMDVRLSVIILIFLSILCNCQDGNRIQSYTITGMGDMRHSNTDCKLAGYSDVNSQPGGGNNLKQMTIQIDGNTDERFTMDGNEWYRGNKCRNKRQKCYNGNIKKTMKICHWNLSSTHWIRKVHSIESMLFDMDPDIAIISEANILSENDDHELLILGYELILPDTLNSTGCCRIANLLKVGIKIKILNEFMDQEVATIWLKVSKTGGKKLHIGTIYRHKHLLNQPMPNTSSRLECRNPHGKKS